MTNTNQHTETVWETIEEPLADVEGHLIDVGIAQRQEHRYPGKAIRVYGWTLRETSVGMPFEHRADTLYLTRHQAVELARRLLNVAADLD